VLLDQLSATWMIRHVFFNIVHHALKDYDLIAFLILIVVFEYVSLWLEVNFRHYFWINYDLIRFELI
jgi:hypothetical protein